MVVSYANLEQTEASTESKQVTMAQVGESVP